MLAPINLIRASFLTVFLSAIIVSFSGCGGAQNLPSVPSVSASCPSGVGGMNADCCDSNGNLLTPPPSSDTSCAETVPGVGGITNPLQAGAASAGSSLGENNAAQTLANGNNAMGTLGQASAATAAPNAAAVGTTGNSLGATPLNVPLAASANNGSGTGGSTGTGTDSSVATAPAAVAMNPDAAPDAGLAGQAVAAYSASGGAGGLLPNGAHETGFHYGNGLTGSIGGASDSEVNFGGRRDPASSGSADPLDYFTRIGLQDSLFKKVERRYRTTSANWAMAQVSPNTVVKKQK